MLDLIERLGNKLPEPALLFALLAAIVVVASALGSAAGWTVQPVKPTVQMVAMVDSAGVALLDESGKPELTPKLDERGRPVVTLEPTGDRLAPKSLLTSEGVYWMLSSMLRNFTHTPALGLIFVGMLGIGVAEKFGLFSALMRALALATPRSLLTPMIVFIGANSSVASDAGYIILPPLAAALFAAVGRSPVAGLAAAFAGVAGGFGGGLFPTAGDGFLAGVATTAAHIIDPDHHTIEATHNLFFKGASAFIVTLGGWFVTDRIVEPRLRREGVIAAGTADETAAITDMALKPDEKRALALSLAAMAAVLAVFFALVLVPGAPLHGNGQQTLPSGNVLIEGPPAAMAAATEGQPVKGLRLMERPGDRWAQVIVPLIFFSFFIPGVLYGVMVGALRNQKDLMEAIQHGVKSLVPVLTILFFLGQFVAYFQYTGLDRMLAYSGGQMLVRADLPVPLLIVLFVVVVIFGDFAMSGMMSKFGVMAPIFIPMFMMVGISPELTTAAYRIGDSVVNVVTPLNSYLLIILMVLQRYKKNAGLGSLISLMLPYSVVLGVLWTGFLLVWWLTGMDLGPSAPLSYTPN
jgi:aminobenzoyl-glutamate transport protein